ncbi:hypothetical protein BaRGS_00028991 [Batillaria attramentaria]|uniref:Uncharacterized protein n=1 Tax=Batillaria attramentaria TaxID=370345 RepID=A0ABD0JXN4_9CAEN
MCCFLGQAPGTWQTALLVLFTCLVCFSNTHAANNDPSLSKTFLEATEPVSLKKLLSDVRESAGSLNATCLNLADGYGNLKSCLKSQCIGVDDVAALYDVSADAPLEQDELSLVAPAVIFSLQQSASCITEGNTTHKHHRRPSSFAVWGYSFLFVTLINLCSLTGILMLPCMNTAIYKTLLMFMVALAVGTLLSSGILVLIPEAFELVGGEDEEESLNYIWKASTVMGGVYLFFVTEYVMRMVNEWRENTKEKKQLDELATRTSMTSSFARHMPPNATLKLKDPTTAPVKAASGPCSCIEEAEDNPTPEKSLMPSDKADYGEEETINDALALNQQLRDALQHKETRSGKGRQLSRENSHHHHGGVAPVAYMVIFGDGLHNFIDGLSIGAAFTDSILVGVSVSVAVMCEELPHELGDFAILLNSGMRLKKALAYNFLSSLMCYFGLVGGMFLYISLADMMPEMNSAAESEDGQRLGAKKTFLLQNCGLLTGYSIILLIAVFGGQINFE